MSEGDDALQFVCDEAACKEDRMFYELFVMEDRWRIIWAILQAAEDYASSHSSTRGTT